MSLKTQKLLDSVVQEITVTMIAIRHAAEPLLYAFILLHQDQLIKGDLSVFTRENVAGLIFSVLMVTWKTKGQRAAEPLVSPSDPVPTIGGVR